MFLAEEERKWMCDSIQVQNGKSKMSGRRRARNNRSGKKGLTQKNKNRSANNSEGTRRGEKMEWCYKGEKNMRWCSKRSGKWRIIRSESERSCRIIIWGTKITTATAWLIGDDNHKYEQRTCCLVLLSLTRRVHDFHMIQHLLISYFNLNYGILRLN